MSTNAAAVADGERPKLAPWLVVSLALLLLLLLL